MRIKEVCKKTGLTDKAVRLYISNQLINPAFTENYAGRKNYSFSDDDVDVLNKIALLRRYDFSVNDIREMLINKDHVLSILEKHLNNTKQNVEESSMVLANLTNAYDKSVSDIDELCIILMENLEPNSFEIMNFINSVWKKIKRKMPALLVICIVGFTVSILLLIAVTILLSKLFLLLD